MKATIEVAVSVEPKRFKLSYRKENAGMGPITLKSTDGQAFKVLSFKSSRNTITADFDPKKEATELVLQPKVDLSKFTERIRGGMIDIVLSHPKAKAIKLSYSIKPLWMTSPAKFILTDAVRGSSVQRTLLIKSNYGEKIEVVSVSSQKKYIDVISREQDGNSVRIVANVNVPTREENPLQYIKDVLEIKLVAGDTINVGCAIYPRRK